PTLRVSEQSETYSVGGVSKPIMETNLQVKRANRPRGRGARPCAPTRIFGYCVKIAVTIHSQDQAPHSALSTHHEIYGTA
ncbi:MAG: hypothetical protein ACIWVG_17590, partial [Gloeotrichia echinulata HAB0833]